MGTAFPVRFRQAVLPDHCPPPARHRRRYRRTGRKHPAEGQFLHPPVHRCAVAFELRADQPAGFPRNREQPRPEPDQGPQQPVARRRIRRRATAHPDDRHLGLRNGQERRHDAGQGGLPERTVPAHPVRSGDAGAVQEAVPDRSAVDQQVLHPRPAREELDGQVGDRPGPHHLHHVVDQPGRESWPRRPSRTTCSAARSKRSTRSARKPARTASTWPATAWAARWP